MKKTKTQNKKMPKAIIIAVMLIVILSLTLLGYAKENKQWQVRDEMKDMMGDMDYMHEQMTKNLNETQKKQMDEMHDECVKSYKRNTTMSSMMS